MTITQTMSNIAQVEKSDIVSLTGFSCEDFIKHGFIRRLTPENQLCVQCLD